MHLISTKFDSRTLGEWKTQSTKIDVANIDYLLNLIENQMRMSQLNQLNL